MLQIVDSAVKGYGWFSPPYANSDKDKFLEWTLTATVISMFLSIGLDVSKFEFVYVEVVDEEEEEKEEIREVIQMLQS